MPQQKTKQKTGYFRFYDSQGRLIRSIRDLTALEVKKMLESYSRAVCCVHWTHPNSIPRAYQLSDDVFCIAPLTDIIWDRYQP